MAKRILLIVVTVLLLAAGASAVLLIFVNDFTVGEYRRRVVAAEFYSPDGSLIERKLYRRGADVDLPDYIAASGYYFEGWCIDGEDGYIMSYEILENTNFYAEVSEIYEFDGVNNFIKYADNSLNYAYSSISFDYKFTSGEVFAFALMGDRWHNHGYEYAFIRSNELSCKILFRERVHVDYVQRDYFTFGDFSSLSDGWVHVLIKSAQYFSYLSSIVYNTHSSDYGPFNSLHICAYSSSLEGTPANVLLKNIKFNK